MNKAMLLKIDREQVGCLAGETNIADILLSLVMAVLGINDLAAAKLLRRRCFSDDGAERTEVLHCEEALEVLDSNDKQQCQEVLRAEDRAHDLQKEIAKVVRRVASSHRAPPATKRARTTAKPPTWPKGEPVTMPKAQTFAHPARGSTPTIVTRGSHASIAKAV